MIDCIFEDIQWRSALNDFTAHGYWRPRSASQSCITAGWQTMGSAARERAGSEPMRLDLSHGR
jgi:hypothetical protein